MGVLQPSASRRSSIGSHSDGVSCCSSDYQCLPSDVVPDFVKMSSVNMDKCQDTHVGPKINFNIVLSGNGKDTERVLGPINRILDNAYDMVGALPSAPYESESEHSWSSKPKDPEPPGNETEKVTLWPRKFCVLGACAVVLLIVTGAITALYWFDWRPTHANSKTSPAPPTSTPPRPISTSRPTPTSPLPSTDATRPANPTPPIPSSGGEIYTDWGQVEPPWKYHRPAVYRFQSVAVDNLPGVRCAAKEECTTILKKAESGASLNYNFLIDDSGNVYYARGFEYSSDNDPKVAKVAFIGTYTSSSHLTAAQSDSFYKIITDNPKKFEFDFRVEAQCIRGISGDSGPGRNVICDIVKSVGPKLKYPVETDFVGSICPWKTAAVVCS